MMKVFFHPDFYREYTSDPAAEAGRMEAIVGEIESRASLLQCSPAAEADLLVVHTAAHLDSVRRRGLYDIAALAAGGAIEAAEAGLEAPSFALIRPPGHHASAGSAWGFCYFNNMAVSLRRLRTGQQIETAFILDFDLHYGDGTVNLLGAEPWVEILNPESSNRQTYLARVEQALDVARADIIAVSAGFDNHLNDWGGLLASEDYRTIGAWVRQAAQRNGAGCYGILEGGYNHNVLGRNVLAFIEGLHDDAS